MIEKTVFKVVVKKPGRVSGTQVVGRFRVAADNYKQAKESVPLWALTNGMRPVEVTADIEATEDRIFVP